MEWIAGAVFGVYGLIILGSILLLIFLIVRRINIKKTERFEDRDN